MNISRKNMLLGLFSYIGCSALGSVKTNQTPPLESEEEKFAFNMTVTLVARGTKFYGNERVGQSCSIMPVVLIRFEKDGTYASRVIEFPKNIRTLKLGNKKLEDDILWKKIASSGTSSEDYWRWVCGIRDFILEKIPDLGMPLEPGTTWTLPGISLRNMPFHYVQKKA